jgi:hypothetical protein
MKLLREIDSASREALLAKPTLTIDEGAQVLGVGSTNFRNALRTGEIDVPVISVGSRKVIPRSAIRRLLGVEG